MKLVRKFRDLQDAVTFSDELKAKGILTHISSSKSHQMSVFTGATEVGVWVVLPEQYDTLNPKVVLTKEQMKELESQGNKAAFNIWNKVLIIGGLICLMFFIYVFVSIE